MNDTPKTHVVMLLDESSSMGPHRSAVVNSFNEYVATLKQNTKRCYLSLFKFSGNGGMPEPFTHTQYLREVFENRKVDELHPLTESQYIPNGMTPLYDAMGGLIQRTKNRLPKDAKVLFVVHTDGQENQSRQFNAERIKRMIAKCEKKRGWTFVYLGEGAAAWNAGYDVGIQNVANYSSAMRGQSMSKLGRATGMFAMNASVGGAAGSVHDSFYADAGETPDDIDPNEVPKVASAIDTHGDAQSTNE